jgi:MinD-like ATPase involved in chromosome partitioning or flagellar assembly
MSVRRTGAPGRVEGNVLLACWAPKGGSGATVVSVALAALLARGSPGGALVVDLDGDVPAAMGLDGAIGPGVGEWLATGPEVPADALARLEVRGPGGVRVLPWGGTAPAVPPDRLAVLLALLASDPRPVVVDCGSRPGEVGAAAIAAASTSLLVMRPCYLALRRAAAEPRPATGVVLVRDGHEALGPEDVTAALGVPVVAVVPVVPEVARAVDAGVLAARLPRALGRGLRHVA